MNFFIKPGTQKYSLFFEISLHNYVNLLYLVKLTLYLQQASFCCTGGHLTVPKLQNTQQSPAFGFNRVLHALHT